MQALEEGIEMKALVKKLPYAGNRLLQDIPIPKTDQGQVLIKVASAGVCSTDIRFHNTNEGKNRIISPVVIGHEGSGIIVEVGEGVKALRRGPRVTSETTFTHCGNCVHCEIGYINMCTNRTALGSSANGYFAQYVLCNAERIHILE